MRIALLSVSLALAALAPHAAAAAPSAPEAFRALHDVYEVAPTKGMVVMTIAVNMAQFGSYFVHPHTATLHRASNDEHIGNLELFRCDTEQGTCVMALSMSPGEFYIGALSAAMQTTIIARSNFPIGKNTGTFKVEAGKLTDLGTLILNPTGEQNRYHIGWMPSHPEVMRDITKRFPQKFRVLSMAEPLGWTTDTAAEGETQARDAQRNPALIGTMYAGPGGELILPAKMGSIVYRDAAGRWGVSNLGVPFRVFDARRHPDGRWFAFTERQLIFEAPQLAGPWTQTGQGDPGRDLVHMGMFADGSVFVIDQGLYDPEVRAAPGKLELRVRDAKGVWSKLPVPKGFTQINDTDLRVMRAADAIFLFQHRENFGRIDLATKAVELSKNDLNSVFYFGDGRFGAIAVDSGFFTEKRSARITVDGGRTWTQLPTTPEPAANYLHNAPWVLADGAVIVRSQSWGARVNGIYKLEDNDKSMISRDGGKTWAPITLPKSACQAASWAYLTVDRIYESCADGRIWSRGFEDKDWKKEWGW